MREDTSPWFSIPEVTSSSIGHEHRSVMFETFTLYLPKQNKRPQIGWESYFPYYAGFSERFVGGVLESSQLNRDAIICDPWNGSGTTTYVASLLGMNSLGYDLNPVMVIVARARLLAPSEADSIEPLGNEIVKRATLARSQLEDDDPLGTWFTTATATAIRRLERSIRRHLVGEMTWTQTGANIDRISGLAATFYVALFTVCRTLAAPFRSSNPTWFRLSKDDKAKIDCPQEMISGRLLTHLRNMANALAAGRDLIQPERGASDIRIADTADFSLPAGRIDLILTSPPYCTRIDYTAATRIELAVLAPLITLETVELARKMIGSTKIPKHNIHMSPLWGKQCESFIDALQRHRSKASNGYYYLTHLDYFHKIAKSIQHIVHGLKPTGTAIFVIQDSYYKELHNDLPSIITEMLTLQGLQLGRRHDFPLRQSMSGRNPHTRAYRTEPRVVEAVLCFHKPIADSKDETT
jgi:hypothetical protein